MMNKQRDASNTTIVADATLTKPAVPSIPAKASSARKRVNSWPYLALYLPTSLALLAVAVISAKTGIPISMFTRDPADIANISPFAGVLSNIGILLWCATATICAFTFALLRATGGKKVLTWFFLASSVITTILLLDDLFLFHERVFPQYFNIRQRYTFMVYMAMTCAFVIGFRSLILQSKWFLLILAVIFFSLSIFVDIAAEHIATTVPFYHLFEDGFKLLGIVSWLGYFSKMSMQSINIVPASDEKRKCANNSIT